MESDAVIQEHQQAQGVPYSDGSGEPEPRRGGSNDESLHEVIEGEGDGTGGAGAHMYDAPYENSGPSQQHQSFSDQPETSSRELYTHHSHSIDETFQNNQPEIVSTVTEESQQRRRETAAVNENAAAVTVTLTFEDGSNLHDIPGFQDPELKGEDEDGGGLWVSSPPNIYSSQILSTVVNDEQEGGYGTETAIRMEMGNGSEIPPSHGIDIIFNTGKELYREQHMYKANI